MYIQQLCIWWCAKSIHQSPSPLSSLLSSLFLRMFNLAADAIDENYGVAVVFHEEERDEGTKTENVVAQEQDPVADVRT